MATSIVTVKNLGDPLTERAIQDRLQTALRQYAGWRVTVLGRLENEDWEIKGENPTEQRSWQVTVTLAEHHTVEFLMHIMKVQIAPGI